MGLSGPKRRTKLCSDPNNTSWSSRTDSFGHRLLTSQGWTPGSFLGATDAQHKDHYTSANASHIRVLLKDDNLGLGASRKREGAATFGLDQFSGLLGRLNGKSQETLRKEDAARRDVRLRLWADGRGGLKFVSAGFLVGDRVEKVRRQDVERQAEEMRLQVEREQEVKLVKTKKVKKGKKRGNDGEVKVDPTTRQNEPVAETAMEDPQATMSSLQEDGEDEKAAKRRRKEEKRRRKSERAQRLEAKRARRRTKETTRLHNADSRVEEARQRSSPPEDRSNEALIPPPNNAVPSEMARSQEDAVVIPRRLIRQRYIQQKRMAGSDLKALNEIFMIKAQT